jgi:hypothetical protein
MAFRQAKTLSGVISKPRPSGRNGSAPWGAPSRAPHHPIIGRADIDAAIRQQPADAEIMQVRGPNGDQVA